MVSVRMDIMLVRMDIHCQYVLYKVHGSRDTYVYYCSYRLCVTEHIGYGNYCYIHSLLGVMTPICIVKYI